MEEFKVNAVNNGYDTFYTDNVVCPYCGANYENTDYEISSSDYEDFECCECGKTFFVTAEYSVSYDSIPTENRYIDTYRQYKNYIDYNKDGSFEYLVKRYEDMLKDLERIINRNRTNQ
jgi:DNA-directed RNA polymerase subunit RPC12/RpoP